MFDYFGVLISVILGLALTHLLRGLGRIIQMRHETRSYWVHIVWTINVVIFVLAIWWGMYWWKGLMDWTVEWFFFIAMYAVTIFMWAYVLFPAEFAPGVDFEAFFYANRRWFFGLQTVVVLMDLPETLQKAAMHLRPVPPQYLYVIAARLLIVRAEFEQLRQRPSEFIDVERRSNIPLGMSRSPESGSQLLMRAAIVQSFSREVNISG